MSSRITHAVAALATVVVVAGCESARPPMAPSPSPSVASAPAASGALDARNTAMPGTRKPDARIVVRRGELDFSRNLGVLSLYGTRGFALTAHVSRSGGVIDAIETCFASNCQPGSTIPLTAAWSGTDLPATVTQDGMTYANVGSVATATTADVRFSGSLVAPPLTKRGFATATAPFTLVGRFVHPDGEQLVTDTFTGEGVAKIWLTNRQGATGWSVERVVYRFRP